MAEAVVAEGAEGVDGGGCAVGVVVVLLQEGALGVGQAHDVEVGVLQDEGGVAGAVDLPEAFVDVVGAPDVFAVGVGGVAALGVGVAADAGLGEGVAVDLGDAADAVVVVGGPAGVAVVGPGDLLVDAPALIPLAR